MHPTRCAEHARTIRPAGGVGPRACRVSLGDALIGLAVIKRLARPSRENPPVQEVVGGRGEHLDPRACAWRGAPNYREPEARSLAAFVETQAGGTGRGGEGRERCVRPEESLYFWVRSFDLPSSLDATPRTSSRVFTRALPPSSLVRTDVRTSGGCSLAHSLARSFVYAVGMNSVRSR